MSEAEKKQKIEKVTEETTENSGIKRILNSSKHIMFMFLVVILLILVLTDKLDINSFYKFLLVGFPSLIGATSLEDAAKKFRSKEDV